ncbi:hypothetical protein EDD85DRAFT_793622 [Armillaria nabsnona]|nr:hypothetical protein EDD85DRAFT_793622 [Armillaria nabsnona]
MSVTVTVTLRLYFLLAIVALIDERSRGTYSIDVYEHHHSMNSLAEWTGTSSILNCRYAATAIVFDRLLEGNTSQRQDDSAKGLILQSVLVLIDRNDEGDGASTSRDQVSGGTDKSSRCMDDLMLAEGPKDRVHLLPTNRPIESNFQGLNSNLKTFV